MKYLKYFLTNNDYETYLVSDEFVTPNVSYIEDDNKINYFLENQLQINNLRFGESKARVADLASYYFYSDLPVASDLTIQATHRKPNVVNGVFQGYKDVTDTYHINKGNNTINEEIGAWEEFTNVIITPDRDDVYIYKFINNGIEVN